MGTDEVLILLGIGVLEVLLSLVVLKEMKNRSDGAKLLALALIAIVSIALALVTVG